RLAALPFRNYGKTGFPTRAIISSIAPRSRKRNCIARNSSAGSVKCTSSRSSIPKGARDLTTAAIDGFSSALPAQRPVSLAREFDSAGAQNRFEISFVDRGRVDAQIRASFHAQPFPRPVADMHEDGKIAARPSQHRFDRLELAQVRFTVVGQV